MIDEKKLLNWLTVQAREPHNILVRNAYRQMLSRIENGEFAPDQKFPGLGQFQDQEQPSYDYSRIRLHDDDDQW